jgi:hypothetical protein
MEVLGGFRAEVDFEIACRKGSWENNLPSGGNLFNWNPSWP